MNPEQYFRNSRYGNSLETLLRHRLGNLPCHRRNPPRKSWCWRETSNLPGWRRRSVWFWNGAKFDLNVRKSPPTTYSQWSLIKNGYPQEVSIMATSIQLIWKLYPLLSTTEITILSRTIILQGWVSGVWRMPLFSFLDASTHLYKRVCPSVRPSGTRFFQWADNGGKWSEMTGKTV